ncbi:hypothetical protein NKG94_16075 [Micromonospora sp. M12]
MTGTPRTPPPPTVTRSGPDGRPAEGANVGWTTSFWPGMIWLAHDLTGDDRHLRAALSHVDSFAAG